MLYWIGFVKFFVADMVTEGVGGCLVALLIFRPISSCIDESVFDFCMLALTS